MEVGQKLGTFEVIGLLGKGGMGEVYKARDAKLNRDVAVKILPKGLADDPERLARFEREAQTLAALNHPNIATVHGFERDAESGLAYLIMEFIDGETLGEQIDSKTLKADDVITLFIDIARGLDTAHESGIIHHDLKPDNVKINADGVVKLIDFGIAKSTTVSQEVEVDPEAATTPMSPVALTAEGTFMGTPVYMSPEQARGKPVDRRTDIWALGCCLFEALTGTLPFKGDTVADTIGAILEREPDWSLLKEDTPVSVKNLIRHCLEKNARRRLSSAGDIAIALEDSLAGPDQPVATAPEEKRGLPALVVGIAMLLVGLIAGAAAVFVTGQPVPDEVAQSTSTGIPAAKVQLAPE